MIVDELRFQYVSDLRNNFADTVINADAFIFFYHCSFPKIIHKDEMQGGVLLRKVSFKVVMNLIVNITDSAVGKTDCR